MKNYIAIGQYTYTVVGLLQLVAGLLTVDDRWPLTRREDIHWSMVSAELTTTMSPKSSNNACQNKRSITVDTARWRWSWTASKSTDSMQEICWVHGEFDTRLFWGPVHGHGVDVWGGMKRAIVTYRQITNSIPSLLYIMWKVSILVCRISRDPWGSSLCW